MQRGAKSKLKELIPSEITKDSDAFQYILMKNIPLLTNAYYNNESALRESNIELDNFHKTEQRLINNLFNYLYKLPFLQPTVVKYENTPSKTITVLTDVYYKLYLTNRNKDTNELREFIKLLIDLRFGDDKKATSYALARNMLWLESNEPVMKNIINFFYIVSSWKPDLINVIKTLNEKKEIKYEDKEKIPEYKKTITYPFYFAFEALLRNTLNDVFIMNGLNCNFYEYTGKLKELSLSAKKIELFLKLESKELLSLQAFSNIFDCFVKVNNNSKDQALAYLGNIINEKTLIQSNDIDNLIQSLNKEYTDLNQQIGKASNFPNVYIRILKDKLNQCSDIKYQEEIMKLVLSNNNLIMESTPLINFYFKHFFIPIQTTDFGNIFNTIKKDSSIQLILLNKEENPVVKEFLLFYFQKKFNAYFTNEQRSIDDKLFGQSLTFLDIALQYIEKINTCNDTLKNIALLYCISYLKVYLYHYIEIVNNQQYNNDELLSIDRIIKNSSSPFGKVVKLYILKLLRKYLSYEEIINTNWEQRCKITWIKEMEKPQALSQNILFDYSFYSPSSNQGNELLSSFDSSYSQTILFYKTQTKNSIFKTSPIMNMTTNTNIKDFLSLIYDTTKYHFYFIPNIEYKEFEMWLYCYRLCLGCLNATGSWYNKIFNKDLFNNLKGSFIPGGEINETIKITSAMFVEDYLNGDNYYAIYVCSCGLHYLIANCGNTNEIGICSNCRMEIGGIDHSMVKRDGHVRVYLNEDIRQLKDSLYPSYEKSLWGEKHEYVKYVNGKEFKYHKASVLMKEYKQSTMFLINDDNLKGMLKVSYDFFSRRGKWMRNMSQVSYRLLSLILYSLLHFGNMLNYITDEQLSTILAPNKTCIEYIKDNWNMFKEELGKSNVKNPYIFLNMLFPELKTMVGNNPILNTKEARHKFEKNITEKLNALIGSYSTFESEYKVQNSKTLQTDKFSNKSIINELDLPNNYSHDKYPYYQYFMIDDCQALKVIKNDLLIHPEKKSIYPILANYINQKANITTLNHLLNINPFANHMLTKYSYTLPREEAEYIKFSDIIKQDEKLQSMYRIYENTFNSIKINDRKYYCHSLDPQVITENDSIAYSLNDNLYIGYGMYLASFYEHATSYQNDFLLSIASTFNNRIVPQIMKNGFPVANIFNERAINYFQEVVSETIPIQDATKTEMVSLDINSTNSTFDSFEELVNCFAKKECFDQNWTVNYSKYSAITINYTMLEEALELALLPGKRMFDKNQRFIRYGYEGCREDNYSLISDYIEKYPQEDLNDDQKGQLSDYIRNNSKANQKLMFFSIPKLIHFINENNFKVSDTLAEIIKKQDPLFKEYKFYDFFVAHTIFGVKQLLKVYEYFEHLLFDDIMKNLNIHIAQDNIQEKTLNELKDYLSSMNERGSVLSVQSISNATRMFISRKMSNKRARSEVPGDKSLLSYICNPEYWPKALFTNPKFDTEFEEFQNKFGTIHICNVVHFLNYISTTFNVNLKLEAS